MFPWVPNYTRIVEPLKQIIFSLNTFRLPPHFLGFLSNQTQEDGSK